MERAIGAAAMGADGLAGQQTSGSGRNVCNQPWVTANSLAASRDAKVASKRNTRL
jgi:hypothetical protein